MRQIQPDVMDGWLSARTSIMGENTIESRNIALMPY